jgi:gamma-polyglutamate biosynthesis protein CapA
MDIEDNIRITLLGDIFPGELAYTSNYGIRSQFKKHKGKPWLDKIRNLVEDSDIIIGNLESPLLSEEEALKKTFFGDPDFAFFLKECKINVINVANNHILEHGLSGFKRTIDALERAELGIVGNIENSGSHIFYKNVKGFKVAIAGFSDVDLHVIQNDGHFAVLNEMNVSDALKKMTENKADLKILCFHWGNEYIHIPSLDQRKLAYKFIDQGADIIAGHHPHVIQPWEKYKNGYIFYSLGNFIFDFPHSRVVSTGLVARLTINKNNSVISNLSGVKLSYKNTVEPIQSRKFERYLSVVEKLYDDFRALDDERYATRYNTMHKRNRFRQRILMKTSLISEFLKIKRKDKIFLIRNLIDYYLT